MGLDRRTQQAIESDQALRKMAEAMTKAGWSVYDISFEDNGGSVSGEAAAGLARPGVTLDLTAELFRRKGVLTWEFWVEATPKIGKPQKMGNMPTADDVRQSLSQ